MRLFLMSFFITIVTAFIDNTCLAQGVAINATGAPSDSSALLDLSSTSKGVLVPRMTIAQRNAIASPATGLMLFQTDGTTGFYYYTGSGWSPVAGSGSLPAGTTGDLLYNNGGSWARLPAADSDQLLTMSGGIPKWKNLLPSLTTTPVSSITAVSAVGGGTFITSGISSWTSRGVCWSTSPHPYEGSSHEQLSGVAFTGSFTTNITGLRGSTTYYVRAYATNIFGTVYGNEDSFTTSFGPGSIYGGGMVGYVLQPGDPGYSSTVVHGLIVSMTDSLGARLTGLPWSNGSLTLTGVTDTAIGMGLTNTDSIIARQGAGTYAASIARAYRGCGYTDWFLPSRDELRQICLYHDILGILYYQTFWSSTEYNSFLTWAVGFGTYRQDVSFKSLSNGALFVRAF